MARKQKKNKDQVTMDSKCEKKNRKSSPNNVKGQRDSNDMIRDYDKRKRAGLDESNRDNDPNWYYLDAAMADQVSQLSFQQLAGRPYILDSASFKTPNILVIDINPCPGVEQNAPGQDSAINLAAFRIFSKLSAFTGRVANYGPQDIATMILAMGATIETVEWARRIFGLGYQFNPRNRAYPEAIITALGVDPVDLMDHFANYRTKFNKIITKLNQIPIPQNIAYLDKCASLFEKVYLDDDTSMAQTIALQIHTTWVLDEISYSGGTKLQTMSWAHDYTSTTRITTRTMQQWLTDIETQVNALLNSSSLQVVYTDLLNLATKLNVPFMQFRNLEEGYMVVPEYNANFLLQVHNMTCTGLNYVVTDESQLANGATPYNDVYPDPNTNRIVYDPTFRNLDGSSATSVSCCNSEAVVDMLTDNPSIEDRVEVTRFISSAGATNVTVGSLHGRRDFALPDHYVTNFHIYQSDGSVSSFVTNIHTNSIANALDMSQIDWSPRIYEVKSDYSGLTGIDCGDLNYYTTIGHMYLRRLHDFVGLGLYDLR